MDLPSCLSTSTGLFKERVPQDWGTQRARFRVDAAAELVFAELPWRRHERPSVGSGIVAVGPGGGRIERAGIVNSSTEAGVVAFSATRAGEYQVYWLPYRQRLTGGTCEHSYLHAAPDGAAPSGKARRRAAKWIGRGGAPSGWVAEAVRAFSTRPAEPPRASLVAMESRGRRFQRHAGELSARAAEVHALLAAHGGGGGGGPLIFAHQVETAEHVVRTDRVPMCWALAGPSRVLALHGAAGQHVLAQVGVLAGAEALTLHAAAKNAARLNRAP